MDTRNGIDHLNIFGIYAYRKEILEAQYTVYGDRNMMELLF